MDRKLILAIDFNNILFGSYYGEKLINSHGININAIKGFFFRIKSLKEALNPNYIVMCNDISRINTFRRKLYKPYKANRKPHDDDIITQLKYGAQIASLIGYPFINNDLYEADDVLGMIGSFATDNDMDLIIASSDKDLYQLASDNVFIMSPRINELIDINWLKKKYQLTPSQWIELKMLQGDAGDNIPGIRGVGEITALKLLHQYGNIENIYNHLNSLKVALKENLLLGKDRLPLIRTLVTIVTDYKLIGLTEDMLKLNKQYTDEVFDLIGQLEIHSLYNVMKYSLLTQTYWEV
jgi:DNA polymerase-1